MVELNDALIAALQQAAADPARALRPLGRPLPWPYQRHRPATPAQLDESQQRLGFRLPVAVRQLYGLVANGGFGPGYGLLGLVDGAVDEFDETAVDSYLARRREVAEDPRSHWPWGLLPFCNWGCHIYSCVDCRPGIPTPPMVVFAPGGDRDWSWAFVGEGRTLSRWLQGWIAGEDLAIRTQAFSALCSRPLTWPWDGQDEQEDEPEDDRVIRPPGNCRGQLALFCYP